MKLETLLTSTYIKDSSKLFSYNKQLKKYIFYKLGKQKRLYTKWRNFSIFEPLIVMKHFKIGQRKLKFRQRKDARRTFVLKEKLKRNCLTSSYAYNLVINIKGKDSYMQVKDFLNFSNLGLLNFEFWHLSKAWVKNVFNKNINNVNLQKFLNGSVLIIKTKTFLNLLDTLDIFSQTLEDVTPVGIFFEQRFFWISTCLLFFSDFYNITEELQKQVKKQSLLFGFLFSSFLQTQTILLCRTLGFMREKSFSISKNQSY